MRKMKQRLRSVLWMAVLVCTLMTSVGFADDVPYTTYNYDYWDNIVYTPAAYIPNGKIETASMTDADGNPVGSLKGPEDVYLASDGRLYIADTGNNRIVVLNAADYSYITSISEFTADGKTETFLKPTGICHSQKPDGDLYIADTEHYRVVILDSEYRFKEIIENPQRENNVLEDDFIFAPQKVIVDEAERLYVIAKNTEEGIMLFDNQTHEFMSFFGNIKVHLTPWQILWKKLSTKEQRTKQALSISTEFNGLDVDTNGFIYASFMDETGQQGVMCLNPKSNDITKKGFNQHTGGDILEYQEADGFVGFSRAVDVVYRDKGIYSFLDNRRGRIFTYDHEGNLLYVFGGFGNQEGCFLSPSALEQCGEEILVSDRNQNVLLRFVPTDYGSLINKAIGMRYDAKEADAVEVWKQVLKYDANFELAYIGIGKAYLSAGDNKQAMEYLKLGMSKQYYSVAYRRYRNEFLVKNLGWILTGAVGLIAAILIIRKLRRGKSKEDDSADTLE